MKRQFCVIGATHGTGLLIARQLLQAGLDVQVLARSPDKARKLLGERADVYRGDVTDSQSLRDSIDEDCRAIFFTVAATGGIDGRGLFGSKAMIRNVTYQGLQNVVDSARRLSFQGRIILPSVVGADQSSVMMRVLDKVKSGLQRNLSERELYLRASGLDYTIVRAPILTNAPAGNSDLRIAPANHKLTAGPKISRGDLARVLILISGQAAASRKTFDLFSEAGVAPSDQQLLAQLERIPSDSAAG
jgi:nucleoside-diphosphate-sugar epimerase